MKKKRAKLFSIKKQKAVPRRNGFARELIGAGIGLAFLGAGLSAFKSTQGGS